MTPTDLQAWLDVYVAAWRSYDPEAIGALFAADATYAYHPWDTGDDVARGRDAIVARWLEEPDEPGSWTGEYRPGLVAGDRATAVGVTRYADGSTFHNLWELRFADRECVEFVEWYMERPPAGVNRLLAATLTGEVEGPGPGDPDGAGVAVVRQLRW